MAHPQSERWTDSTGAEEQWLRPDRTITPGTAEGPGLGKATGTGTSRLAPAHRRAGARTDTTPAEPNARAHHRSRRAVRPPRLALAATSDDAGRRVTGSVRPHTAVIGTLLV